MAREVLKRLTSQVVLTRGGKGSETFAVVTSSRKMTALELIRRFRDNAETDPQPWLLLPSDWRNPLYGVLVVEN